MDELARNLLSFTCPLPHKLEATRRNIAEDGFLSVHASALLHSEDFCLLQPCGEVCQRDEFEVQ
jgi:hypothetical protein